MNSQSLLIRQISQKDNQTFTIEWNDGSTCDYRLSDLQQSCPCAHCMDQTTGKRLVKTDHVVNEVKAVRLSSVGRYALRIQFTSGCSNGLYSFEQLRRMQFEQSKKNINS